VRIKPRTNQMLASTIHFSKNNHTPPTPTHHTHQDPKQQEPTRDAVCGPPAAAPQRQHAKPHTKTKAFGPFPQDPTVHRTHHPKKEAAGCFVCSPHAGGWCLCSTYSKTHPAARPCERNRNTPNTITQPQGRATGVGACACSLERR